VSPEPAVSFTEVFIPQWSWANQEGYSDSSEDGDRRHCQGRQHGSQRHTGRLSNQTFSLAAGSPGSLFLERFYILLLSVFKVTMTLHGCARQLPGEAMDVSFKYEIPTDILKIKDQCHLLPMLHASTL
jgi:hypothetical protein